MSAIEDVAAERRRQNDEEVFSAHHDDEHPFGEIARAAAAYAISSFEGNSLWAQSLWPWDWIWWKPKSPRADLIRAAALIVAEIDRLDRATGRRNRIQDSSASNEKDQ